MNASDDEIGRLLRLKHYEQPPPGYFENFRHEFWRRQHQRERLVRQSLWRVCVERAEGLALRFNMHPLASATVAVVVASAAVISIRSYQPPDTAQLAVQASPVPSTPSNTEKELDFAPPVFVPKFDLQPMLLPRSRNVPMLPVDSLRPGQFLFSKFEWESLEDQSLLEK